jgi:hypothetical protein
MNRRKAFQKRVITNTVLLVCGGQTEKWYFENYKKKDAKIEICCKCKNSASSPTKVVDYAITLKNQNPNKYLKVYAIFDKDDFVDFDNAIENARKNDICPIFSNQSFELWFLQYFEITSSPIGDRKNYKPKLNAYYKKNYKNANLEYSKTQVAISKIQSVCSEKIEDAINNCKINFQRKNLSHIENKSKFSNLESVSNVFSLVEYLEKLE